MHTASLCAEIVSLCADIHRAEYRLIELIRELDRSLPAIEEAFRLGELSYSKVRAITRVADFLNEHELVAMAKSCSAADVAQRVKTLRQAERLQDSTVAFEASQKLRSIKSSA